MPLDQRRTSIAVGPRNCVEKRDGRLEELDTHKLVLSIYHALEGHRTLERWRVSLVASVVLHGLRALHGQRTPLSTSEIATATFQVMDIASFHSAALAYRALGRYRHRAPIRAPRALRRWRAPARSPRSRRATRSPFERT